MIFVSSASRYQNIAISLRLGDNAKECLKSQFMKTFPKQEQFLGINCHRPRSCDRNNLTIRALRCAHVPFRKNFNKRNKKTICNMHLCLDQRISSGSPTTAVGLFALDKYIWHCWEKKAAVIFRYQYKAGPNPIFATVSSTLTHSI